MWISSAPPACPSTPSAAWNRNSFPGRQVTLKVHSIVEDAQDLDHVALVIKSNAEQDEMALFSALANPMTRPCIHFERVPDTPLAIASSASAARWRRIASDESKLRKRPASMSAMPIRAASRS